MFKMKTLLPLILLLIGASTQASASILIEGWAINVDGNFITFFNFAPATNADINATIPVAGGGTATVSSALFDAGSIDTVNGTYQSAGTGLGQITVHIVGAPNTPHTVTLWLDETLTGSEAYWMENGAAVGSPNAGTSYGLDEPGYGDPNGYQGSLYSAVHLGTALPQVDFSTNPTDISLALRLSTLLPTGDSMFTFTTSYNGIAPSGFHLEQTSANGLGGTLYFSAASVNNTVSSVPEPGTWVLMTAGGLLIGVGKLAGLKKRA
jgi:hypothetical protein